MTALALCAYWLAVYGAPAIVRILAVIGVVWMIHAAYKAI